MRLAITHYRGMGDANTQLSNQLTGSLNAGLNTANATGSILTGSIQGAIGATGALLSTTLITGSAICPPCAPIFAIGAALVPIIAKIVKGCGQSCIEASDYANQIEPLLVQNLQAYTSTPAGQRTKSMQQSAINNFNASFSQLVTACQNIGGQGGTACIKDRQAGGCTWRATPWKWNSDGSFTPAGASGSGSSCWNWVFGYHDPIANDPYVVADPVTAGGAGGTDVVSSILGALGLGSGGGGAVSPSPLLLVGLGVVAYLVLSD